MADTDIHESATSIKAPENPTYSVIVYKSSELPKNYIPMLYSRWLRSLRFGNNTWKKMSSNDYYKNYHSFIGKLLNKPDSLVRLAVLSDDDDVCLGFSVSREDVLDYVHVHTDYRRIGIAKNLIPSNITTFTHITATGLMIWQKNKNYKELKFNPFA